MKPVPKFNQRHGSKLNRAKMVAKRKARGAAAPVRKSSKRKQAMQKDQGAWPERDVALLRAAIADGLSYGQVRRLKLPHRTRNSIIGKCHRLGIREKMAPAEARIASGRHSREASFATRLRRGLIPCAETAQIVDLPTKGKAMKELLKLGGADCRWPLGDPKSKSFGFCGAPQKPGEVYCCDHHAMAFEPITPSKKADRRRVERIANLPMAA